MPYKDQKLNVFPLVRVQLFTERELHAALPLEAAHLPKHIAKTWSLKVNIELKAIKAFF